MCDCVWADLWSGGSETQINVSPGQQNLMLAALEVTTH